MAHPCGDTSKPMRRHFQDWLCQRYEGEVTALRKAWGDPQVDFDSAQVPSENAQLNSLDYSFRDPQRERNVIDYLQCLSELCGDLVVEYCQTVKDATNRRSLAGAFYGYVLEMSWNSCFFSEWPERWQEGEYSTLQRSGHLGLQRVLASPEVDFLVSPYSYGFRGIGGHGPSMLPVDSVRRHRKLYIYEEDSRVHVGGFHTLYGRAANADESRAILRRNFAYIATHGQGVWTFPQGDDDLFREVQQFKQLGELTVATDRSSVAEIAVLVDDESFLYESLRNNLDVPLIFHQRLQGLPRLGAPYDLYLLDDFLTGELRPYRLYIFLNAFRLDQNRRAALKREIRQNQRVALWLYAPGYLQEEASLEHMQDLTAFQFGMGRQPWSSFMHLVDFTHPITTGLSQELFWGTESLISPHFHLEDDDATILGQVVYSQGSCVPGMGVKESPDWTSIYIASPNVPAPVLRGIAQFAGVHLYSDAGDVLYASRQLLGVHTVSGGERTFKLPQKVQTVVELFSREMVAQESDRFQRKLEPRSSVLFHFSQGKESNGSKMVQE